MTKPPPPIILDHPLKAWALSSFPVLSKQRNLVFAIHYSWTCTYNLNLPVISTTVKLQEWQVGYHANSAQDTVFRMKPWPWPRQTAYAFSLNSRHSDFPPEHTNSSFPYNIFSFSSFKSQADSLKTLSKWVSVVLHHSASFPECLSRCDNTLCLSVRFRRLIYRECCLPPVTSGTSKPSLAHNRNSFVW